MSKPSSPNTGSSPEQHANNGQHSSDSIGDKPKAGLGFANNLKQEARTAFDRGKESTSNLASSKMPEVKEVPWYLTPVEMIKHMVHGSVVNALRRGREIILPARDGLEGAWNTIAKLVTSPVKSLFHPIKYLANPTRFLTAGAREIKNITVKAPVSLIDEWYEGMVENPIHTLNFKTTN